MLPKVSVMVITYNQKDFIHETIKSVLEQDYLNIEYVIADDGSTDGTAEVINEYAKKYPNIIIPLINLPNVGITANSNRGLKACTGEYIAIQGGDDVFLPGKISKQVEWLEQDENRVLCGHYLNTCDENSIIIGKHVTIKVAGKGPENWIEQGTLYGATSIMLRASAINTNGFDERLPIVSDWKLYIDTLLKGGEYGYLTECLGLYRKHDNNVTNIKEPVMKDAEETFNILEKELKGCNKSIKIGRAYILDYGRGIQNLNIGNHKIAIQYFLKSIIRWPFNWKPYLRLAQSCFKTLIKR
ncbi:MAG: hypothetical protein COB35_06900 [Gammaproteobacteria bacterium]|nr:MAG: hypothetical protein COB35_06900 [Gammaproteobacteria bacterium]